MITKNKHCSIPNDPEQKHNIKCAICGIQISFEKKEVYIKKSSYVCRRCLGNKKTELITVSYKHPKKGKLVYLQFLPNEKTPQEIIHNGKVYIQYGVH
jgi:ribosome-binding protein aMBF1 (putative translation factor)